MLESVDGGLWTEVGSKALLAIVGAAVGAAAYPLFSKVVYPYFVELFREPTKLKPEFVATLDFGGGKTDKIRLRIKKLGYQISGTLRFEEGDKMGAEYEVKGRYNHGIISFHYSACDASSTSQGSASLLRTEDGAHLTGHIIYFGRTAGVLLTAHCEFAEA